MSFKFDLSKVDFRTTPVENMFLDTYLGSAPGDAIKIYLYGWRACYGKSEGSFSLDEFGQALSLSDEELQEGLQFWIDAGLVTIVEENQGHTIYFRSLILLWAGLYESVESLEASVLWEAKSKEGLHLSLDQAEASPSIFDSLVLDDKADNISRDSEQNGKKEDPTLENDQNRRAMFTDLENYLSQGLTYEVSLKPAEIRQIHEFLDQYPVSPDFFLYAYKKASQSSEASSRSLNYLMTIIENWIRFEHITEIDQLDQYLEKEAENKKNKKKTRRARAKKKAENLSNDQRMSKEERSQWVKQKLEQSRKRSLRGVEDDEHREDSK